MTAVLFIVLPVFLIVGTGYALTRLGVFPAAAIDGLMAFAVRFAVPVLLFNAMATLDLGRAFDARLLLSFYVGSFSCFALGILFARRVWGRRPGESVAIGFCALFSNTLLLGLPIVTRAYGEAEITAAFAIIALHAPVGYLLGIVTMEALRADGSGALDTARRAAKAMFSNALSLGIAAGLLLNLSGLGAPRFFWDAVDMTVDAALPAALFGLGGALTRYRLRSELGEAAMVAALSLVVHPAIAWTLSDLVFGLPDSTVRAAVVIAAMPPGMNVYVFAAMYGRAEGTAASAALLATAAAVLSVTFWLWFLGGGALG